MCETLRFFPLLTQLQLSQTEKNMFDIVVTGTFYGRIDASYDIKMPKT